MWSSVYKFNPEDGGSLYLRNVRVQDYRYHNPYHQIWIITTAKPSKLTFLWNVGITKMFHFRILTAFFQYSFSIPFICTSYRHSFPHSFLTLLYVRQLRGKYRSKHGGIPWNISIASYFVISKLTSGSAPSWAQTNTHQIQFCFSLHPAKCRGWEEAPKWKTKDLILCCLVRATAHLKRHDSWVCSNGGMMIGTGKSKRLPLSLKPISDETIRDWTWRSGFRRECQTSWVMAQSRFHNQEIEILCHIMRAEM